MKKFAVVLIGILLSTSMNAQVPFSVDKKLNVTNSDTVEVVSDLTNISYVFKSRPKVSTIRIIVENRDFGIKVSSRKMDVVNYERVGEGIGGLTIYTCESEDLGSVVIEEELYSMTGRIKYDRDRDGVFEEIFVLK